MQYVLTEEDIKNFNLQGSTAGDIATDADLEAMGKLTAEQIEAAPAVTPSQTTLDYTEARTQGVEPEYAPQSGGFPSTANPAAVAGAGAMGGVNAGMASLLSQPVPQDPFENLSRSQRMMLGFSALQDAGMALQGKEGGAFEATMSGFRERADMERKRQAALANQQALQGLFGGAGEAVDMTSLEGLRAHRARLAKAAVMFPDRAAGLAVQIADIDKNIERLDSAQSSLQSTNMGIAAVEALMRSPDLDQITGMKGVGNEWLEKIGAAPRYSTLMSYVEQLRGLNFMEAYKGLKGGGPITDIEGAKATAARARVDRALRGTPADLKAALEEVEMLFQEAREKNPMYDQELDFGQQTPPPATPTTFNQDEIDDYLKKD